MLYIHSEGNRKKASKQDKTLFYWAHNLVQEKIIQMIKKAKKGQCNVPH